MTTEATPRAGEVQHRKLAVLLTAKAISDVGFALDFVCLATFVWVRTGSGLATGLLGLSLYAGGIVGGRLGHRYGAHWDRRSVMIAADLARATALLTLALLPTGAQIYWLFPAMTVVGLGRSTFEATLSAAMPVLAGDRIQLVNSIMTSVRGVALIVGMGLATIAVPLVGFRGVFGLDAATYALSAVAVFAVRARMRETVPSPGRKVSGGIGWGTLAATGIAALLMVRGLDAVGSSSHHVGLPMLGDSLDPDNPASIVGGVWMAWAAGTLAGSLGLRPLLRPLIGQVPQLVFYVATAVMSVGFVAVFWLDSWALVLGFAMVAGVGDALSEVTYKQAIQRLPDIDRGPAFGLSQSVINTGFIVGLLVTGVALSPDYLAWWVTLLHGIPFAAAILAAAWTLVRRTETPR